MQEQGKDQNGDEDIWPNSPDANGERPNPILESVPTQAESLHNQGLCNHKGNGS